MSGNREIKRFRTLFLSDFHLGARAAQADLLLDFLKYHDADTIFLIGDIVDGWRLRRVWYWPQSHNDVVQKLLRKARKGTRVVYIPGNHDEMLRQFAGHNFGAVEMKMDDIHEMADGRKFLIIHGDEFDVVVRNAKWLAFLGDWAYRVAIVLNTQVNRVRRRLGFQYWSLSAWLKLKVKNAVNYIGEFESALSAEAARRGADGVICGHIHHPGDMMMKSGVRYVNTGDWVESCTAVAEHGDGTLEIIRWTDHLAVVERLEAEGQVARAA